MKPPSFHFAVGCVGTLLLIPNLSLAQPAPAPPPGVPAVAAPPPPPPPAAVAGAATAIAGVTPQYVDKPKSADNRKEGWDPHLSIGITGAFANNSNVAGQADGASVSLGAKLDGTLMFNEGSHEWRTVLGILASTTRTPVINRFVKTSDALNLETIYLYHVVPWFGPFFRASLGTSMFPGTDVRATAVDYVITNPDGTSGGTITADHLALSDAFKPLTLKQSAGAFVQPITLTPLTLELRGGLGAQEVFADHQALVTNFVQVPVTHPTVSEVDVSRLQDSSQLGIEAALSVWGSLVEKRVTYRANADVMMPFARSALAAHDTRSLADLTNVQLDASLSFKLIDWASLDYQVKALRQPQVIDVFQVQNTLLLTFGMTFGSKPPAPTPPACVPAPPPPPPAPSSNPPAK